MNQYRKKLSMILSITLVILSLSGLNVFAGESEIMVYDDTEASIIHGETGSAEDRGTDQYEETGTIEGRETDRHEEAGSVEQLETDRHEDAGTVEDREADRYEDAGTVEDREADRHEEAGSVEQLETDQYKDTGTVEDRETEFTFTSRIYLTGPDRVLPRETFSLSISLYCVRQDVNVEKIILSYDEDVFEFVDVQGESDDIQIGDVLADAPGSVEIQAVTLNGVTDESMPLLEAIFKVKSGIQNTTGTIAVTESELRTSGEEIISAELGSKTIQIGSEETNSPDINSDGTIDVIDLAIVAYYYGKNSDSEDWEQAKIADLNSDGEIDISDLAYVATKILE